VSGVGKRMGKMRRIGRIPSVEGVGRIALALGSPIFLLFPYTPHPTPHTL
jgi:hypothetical protein